MKQIIVVAQKEVTDGTRNRWILIVTALMAGLALVLTLSGQHAYRSNQDQFTRRNDCVPVIAQHLLRPFDRPVALV